MISCRNISLRMIPIARILSSTKLALSFIFSKLSVILLIIFWRVPGTLRIVLLSIAHLELHIARALPTCITLTYHTIARLIR